MHLLESLASFLAASTVTNTSSSSNLPKPLSRFLAAGSGAYGPPMWERVGEVTNNVHNGAATYGPPMLEKLGEVTDNVRNGAAAYGPPMLERLGEVANNVRHGAAAPVWEKMEEATHNVHNHAAVYGPPMLEKLGEVANSVRNGAAAYGQPVWEKAEVIRNVRHTPPFICHQMLMLHQDAQWSAANPVPAACAVVGAGGVIAVAAPGIVSALILSSAGFGATGVQAGEC